MKERMSNMGKRIWEDRKYQIMAFLVCLGSFYLYYSWMSVIKGGNEFLLSGDTFALYVPLTRQFFRDLVAGENLGFSWSNGFGMNTVPLYTSYVGGSIFNLLFLFFAKANPATVLTVMIGLKIALTGACFVFFVEKGMGQKGLHTIMFALMYAMSGAQMTIYIQNYIWMDAEYILPVLLVLVMEFAKSGRGWCKLLFLYAYLFLCSYFTGYIVGFFSALFFILYLFVYNYEKKIKKILCFTFVAIGAAGVCAFALLPTVIFIITKAAPDATIQTGLELNVKSILSSFLMARKFEMNTQQPYLFVGSLSFLGVPAFFATKNVIKKDKVIFGILLGILALSCLLPALYLFWHGFDTPDGWFFRFSYLISFTVVVVACVAWGREVHDNILDKKGIPFIVAIVLGELVLICIAGIMQYGYINIQQSILYTVLLTVAWVCIVWRLAGKINKNNLYMIGIVLCIAEMVGNGCSMWPAKSQDKKNEDFYEAGREAENYLKGDTDFYRVNFTNCRNWNWDSFWGIKGNSDFGTLENYEVRKFLGNLGGYTSPRLIFSYGQNPLTQLIMGVKYNIKGKDEFLNDVTMDGRVTRYNYYLGLGFLVDGAVEKLNFSAKGNIYDNCNQMASSMTGKDITLFYPYNISKVEMTLDNMNMEYQDNQYCFKILEPGKIGQATFVTDEGENPLYVTFDNGYSVQRNDGAIVLKGTDEANDAGDLGVRYSNELHGKDGKCQVSIAISSDGENRTETIRDILFYECNMDELKTVYDVLRENLMNVNKVRNGYVEGHISVNDTGKILFTSIPYDQGWKMTSDLEGTEMVPILDGAFIGVKFSNPGEYMLTWKYTVPGQKKGMIISLVTLLIIGFVMVSEQIIKKK